MPNILITHIQVQEVLQELDVNSSGGSDGVHPRFLKELAAELACPLAHLFNSTLQDGMLPKEWLTSVVVPVFKKGSRFVPINYRPISLTSPVCKSLERIIVKLLNVYLHDNNLISDRQYGFRGGHSTSDQLLVTYEEISSLFDKGHTVDLIFSD